MKNITRIIAAMALSVMLSGLSMAQVSVWDGSAEPWTHGSGTAEDPYLIESAANLAWLAQKSQLATAPHLPCHYLDTCFLLMVDLDLNGDQGLEWDPIGGVVAYAFAGHFDGGHHTVDNMRITLPNGNPVSWNGLPAIDLLKVGLFGTVAAGSIRNLTMGERCVITIDEEIAGNASLISIGMLAGMVNTSPWWSMEEIPYLISDCHNHGSITMAYPDDRSVTAVGGLVGYAGSSRFGNISTSFRMEGCSNSGTLVLELPMRAHSSYPETYNVGLGGLVGVALAMDYGLMWCDNGVWVAPYEFVMEDCHNSGSLRMGLDLISYEACKRAYAGGIVGNAGYRMSLNRCSNRGDVTVTMRSSTGLTEYNSLLFCSGIAGGYGNDYRVEGDHWAQFVANITNCYNHASIRCEVEEGLAVETTVSGITGRAISESELVPEVHVSNCYHVGELVADQTNGITPADTMEALEVNNSYYLEGNAPDNGYGTPMPDETMKTQEFVDLLNGDGPVTFYMDQWEVNDGYPVLDDKSPFLDNSEWYYEIRCDDGSVYYQYLRCAGDTTVNSHKTKVVVRTNQIYDKEPVEVTREYLYEEGNVIYWWNKELHEFTVLYDFGAEVGDAWETKVGQESITVHVDAEKPYYDPNTGRTYRMLVVSDADDAFSGEIICGVGHTTSLFPERLMNRKGGFAVDGLRCYWNDHVLVLHTTTDDCDAIYSEVHGVEENGTATFVVYPNPTDGLLYVETPYYDVSTREYRITNVLGQTLMIDRLDGRDAMHCVSTIDVSALPNGLYFLTVDGKTIKLMKQ